MSIWAFFTDTELGCRCGVCQVTWRHMDPILMNVLTRMRTSLGFPFPVTSAARCIEHDDRHGGARAHTPQPETQLCYAVDIQLSGANMFRFFDLATREYHAFFRGIGIKAHGPHANRFLHVDALPRRPIEYMTIWTYS